MRHLLWLLVILFSLVGCMRQQGESCDTAADVDSLAVAGQHEEACVISPYDTLFQHYAAEIGWDWRLLAALAYAESRFDTAAVSAVHAVGLMQLMPVTLRAMGVEEGKELCPEENVRAAVCYLRELECSFRDIKDEPERLHFVLAAYNAGPSRIREGRALAAAEGADHCAWSDTLSHLGVFPAETFQFVKEVLNIYKKLAPN